MQVSFSQYVLKVHGRCNLACDHCYVYEHADQSWRGKPKAISLPTAAIAAGRIAQHASAHNLPDVHVVLHGGEPLLLGREEMRGVLSALIESIAPVTRLDLRIHSNGVLLDEQWCALFSEFGVMVGISLDGDQSANDLHRRYADGRSSFADVQRALALLRRPSFRHLYAGILCTVDLASDPIAVYDALVAERPPRLDLLLPHATWENPPNRPAGTPHPYADWLLRVYRRWTAGGRPVPIRLFDSVLSAAAGGPSWTESIGLDPADLLVIETDGSWEQTDSMKTAFDGAPATGMDVRSHSIDAVATHPGVAGRQAGLDALCATCRACPVVRTCGGGLYSHRYRADTGFDSPSVYCQDLLAFISTIMEEPVPRPARAPDGPPRPVHELPAGAFDALAAGAGTVAALEVMAQVRQSTTRVLVATVANSVAENGWRDGGLRDATAAGWAELCALDARYPEAVAETFAHPYTAAWAMRCLAPPAGADPDLDRAHLAGFAVAAATRAGETAELRLPVRDGLVHLPGLGAMPANGRTALVRAEGGDVRLVSPASSSLLLVRRVDVPVLPVSMEDLDPFRDCHEWPITGRLTEPELAAWRAALDTAGRSLVTDLPEHAQLLSAGLRAIVPLRPDAARGMRRSSTARLAHGAVGIALPAGSDGLDELLVHEFQHVKLNVLFDMYELFDAKDPRRLDVPWREDPRPIDGVLHGVFAHIAICQLWRARGAAGRAKYLRYRDWVLGVAEQLLATGALTAHGERFVAGMIRGADGDP